TGPVTSSFGLHLLRVTARGGFRPVTLAEVGDRVRVDYRLAQRDERNRQALAQLRARYRIEVEKVAG
ncbi:MAG: peptidyl-prolyl cis-trans isomerase, partial [Nevskiales bacterium]